MAKLTSIAFSKKSLGALLSSVLVASMLTVVLMTAEVKPAYATFSVKKGIFEGCSIPTGESSCTKDITVGFEVKALIIFAMGPLIIEPPQSCETCLSPDSTPMIGFSDGTNDRVIAAVSDDGISTANTKRTSSESLIIKLVNSAEASVQSFDSDGFILTFTEPGNTLTFHYLALGGGDITDVKVDTITSATSDDDEKHSNIGFQPDFVMFLYNRLAANSQADHAVLGFGFATSSTEQGAMMIVSEDGRSTSDTARAQRTDRVIYQPKPSDTSVVDAEAELVLTNSTGFTLKWTNVPNNTDDKFFYLAMKGGKYDVGKFNQKTSTGIKQINGTGFQPTGLLLASFNNEASTSTENHARLSFGASDGTNQGFMWGGDRDNVSPTYVTLSHYVDKVILLATETETGATKDAEADFDSFHSDGFKLNWNLADSSPREILYVAFGNT
jgi:hypothetical protein